PAGTHRRREPWRAPTAARPTGARRPDPRRNSPQRAAAPSSRTPCSCSHRGGSREGRGSCPQYGYEGRSESGEVGLFQILDWRYHFYIRSFLEKNTMTVLDDIDKRIVQALQADGRLSIVDLADRVGLSPTPCQRRVKRLEEEGVIARYAALVVPSAVG